MRPLYLFGPKEFNHFLSSSFSNEEFSDSYLFSASQMFTIQSVAIGVDVVLVWNFVNLYLVGFICFLRLCKRGIDNGQGQVDQEESSKQDNSTEVDPNELGVCLLV